MASIAEVPGVRSPFPIDLNSVEAGLPLAAIADFVASSGLQLKDIYDVVIPARTLKHRRDRKESLNLDESDKLARLVRAYDFAVRVFADKERALRWLNKPKDQFSGRTPIHMLRTDLGGRMVEEMLIQIDEGMFT